MEVCEMGMIWTCPKHGQTNKAILMGTNHFYCPDEDCIEKLPKGTVVPKEKPRNRFNQPKPKTAVVIEIKSE